MVLKLDVAANQSKSGKISKHKSLHVKSIPKGGAGCLGRHQRNVGRYRNIAFATITFGY